MDIPLFKRWSASKKFGLWKKKQQSIIGIDIGSSAIKVVQLKKEKERAVLETYGELAIGPYAQASVGQVSRLIDKKLIEALSDVIKEAGVTAKKTVVSIPLRSSFIIMIELPVSPDNDNFDKIVRFEARKYIPIPLSEVEFDWLKVPPALETPQQSNVKAGKKPLSQVLLAAVHKDVIEKYKRIISQAGLYLQGFEIEVFGIARSVISRETYPILLIDFGASAAKMLVVDYGIIRLSHVMEHGSQNLTLALSRSLNVDFSRAEEMKREIGLSNRPEHQEIKNIMEPILDYIFLEANRVMSDYRRKYSRSIGRIILTGGGSLLKGIVDYTVKKFGIEVNLANPFAKVEYPAFLQPVLKQAGPEFSVALGLALRELSH